MSGSILPVSFSSLHWILLSFADCYKLKLRRSLSPSTTPHHNTASSLSSQSVVLLLHCIHLASPRQNTMASLLLLLGVIVIMVSTAAADLNRDLEITWGDGRAKMLGNGDLLTLSLDKASGSGFQSRKEYLFGKIDMQIKLVPGNSAGTVTAYYLSSQGPTHDEIDFEFLGNVTGEPYTLHTNVFARGKGNREQQFRLWFDPTKDFHTYSVVWNPRHIIFLVDNVPIRDFRNHESNGVEFPKDQPMRIYSSLWNADDWATQGGRVKADWTKAPFTASYRGFGADVSSTNAWFNQELDSTSQKRMRAIQRRYMIYNYCTDRNRFPQGLPKECSL